MREYSHFPLIQTDYSFSSFLWSLKHAGLNSEISYSIQTDNKNSSEFFHVDENEGTVFLKVRLNENSLSNSREIINLF